MRKALPEFYAITAPLEAREDWGESNSAGDSSSVGDNRGQSKTVGDLSGARAADAHPSVAEPASLFTLTPGFSSAAFTDWLSHFEHLLESGIELVQLRVKDLPAEQLEELARHCQSMAAERGVRLLLNGPAGLAKQLGMAGVHLTSDALMASGERPLPESYLVGASCHCPEELSRAEAIGADFACLSPVKPTKGYGKSEALGFEGFARLIRHCSIPVYGLGGLRREDLAAVSKAGGHGVAGISAFW